MQIEIITASAEETMKLGEITGSLLFPGAIILVSGGLGTGKTVYARGVAKGLGVSTPVTSPSFMLLNVHQGRLPFYHFDLYRLDAEEDLFTIDLEEYLAADGVCFVEWADKFPGVFTMPALRVEISAEGLNRRHIAFTACEDAYCTIIRKLQAGG